MSRGSLHQQPWRLHLSLPLSLWKLLASDFVTDSNPSFRIWKILDTPPHPCPLLFVFLLFFCLWSFFWSPFREISLTHPSPFLNSIHVCMPKESPQGESRPNPRKQTAMHTHINQPIPPPGIHVRNPYLHIYVGMLYTSIYPFFSDMDRTALSGNILRAACTVFLLGFYGDRV